MAPVRIRAITKADEPRWRELFTAYHAFYKMEPEEAVFSTTLARFLDPNERVYGAVAVDENDKIIGFVHWLYHRSTLSVKDYIYLNDLFVQEDIRSKGVGRALIEHVYEDADKNDAGRVYWQTQHFNHRAQLLYVKAGFKTDFVVYQRPPK